MRSAEDSPPRPTARTARVGTPEQALRLVEEYCATRVPEGLEDEIRIECSLRGRAITIVERRPPWNPEFGADWTESKVAQLRYDSKGARWTLHAVDKNSRWFAYDNIGPSRDVAPLLKEIEADPSGIFWG
jgi:hypothetical protein